MGLLQTKGTFFAPFSIPYSLGDSLRRHSYSGVVWLGIKMEKKPEVGYDYVIKLEGGRLLQVRVH